MYSIFEAWLVENGQADLAVAIKAHAKALDQSRVRLIIQALRLAFIGVEVEGGE